jgi:hypothetical protein
VPQWIAKLQIQPLSILTWWVNDVRRDKSVFISLSVSEGERAVTISADYLLSFVFARARLCPDIRN